MRPNLIIPGAPKSGTSSVAQYLASHPAIFIGPIKEPNYWSKDMPYFSQREGIKGDADYYNLYRAAPEKREYVIDASVHYLSSDVAIGNIHNNLSRPKFLVCLRSQIEIAQAWHMQMVNSGYENENNFVDAWRLIEPRCDGSKTTSFCPEPALLNYRNVSSVGAQSNRLIEVVGSDNVHPIFMSDLKNKPRDTYLKILSFLDVPDDGRNDFPIANKSNKSKFKSIDRIIRSPRVRPTINRIWSLIGIERSYALRRAFRRHAYADYKRPELPVDLIKEMNESYVSDNRLLYKNFGRDFSSN